MFKYRSNGRNRLRHIVNYDYFYKLVPHQIHLSKKKRGLLPRLKAMYCRCEKKMPLFAMY